MIYYDLANDQYMTQAKIPSFPKISIDASVRFHASAPPSRFTSDSIEFGVVFLHLSEKPLLVLCRKT
ncbi:hypothetical protein K7X08_035023 [Anisodus acutangulus]|uniref:Uncharacterized protein n=1 Tax=Anisodus acutangulus TaxID=402998 RepID=A0A9Q1LJB7_9SOLA|nr:hypothetical protein K7X08_035023 [Anisodus acutangulus]